MKNSSKELTKQPPSFNLCDSGLWIKEFELILYKKNNKFDSVFNVIIKKRDEVKLFVIHNNFFFTFPEIDYRNDFIIRISSNYGRIYSFAFSEIELAEAGYGHDRHLVVNRYKLNNKVYRITECDFNLCPLLKDQEADL